MCGGPDGYDLPCGEPEASTQDLIENGCFGIDEPLQDGEICKNCPVKNYEGGVSNESS